MASAAQKANRERFAKMAKAKAAAKRPIKPAKKK